ncbi:MAG TPA: amidohydrolase family protein [Terracidiphilus sp.]|jgi:L-fuconolactonase
MRIDAHQHFWQYNPVEYDWINDAMGVLKRDFLPPDLKPLLESLHFEGCIAVQARQNLEETQRLLELADRYSFIRGVVGWVDLCSPELPTQLVQVARHPRLVGVRHIVQAEPDDRFMLRPDFQRGIAQLAEFGLTYDVLVFPRQLPAAFRLVEAFPTQPFVLDHIAKPPIADGKIEPWATGLRALATLPNVCCKLSGMVTEAQWKTWQPTDFRPYLDLVLDAFGPARLMIGSDWPVCLVSAAYQRTMGIVLDYIGELSPSEQAGILGENCARFYGVP